MPFVKFILRNLARGILCSLVLVLVLGGLDATAPIATQGLVSIQSLIGKRGGSWGSGDLAYALPQLDPNYVGVIDGRFVRADDTGAPVESITETGNEALDDAVAAFIVSTCGTGDDALRRAYDAIRAVPYQTMSHVPESQWLAWYNWAPSMALQLFDLNEANCYRYAAAMVYVARALGYDAQVRVGYASHNLVEHAWCEVTLPDGEVRVIDCSLGNDHAYPELDWCMVSYEDAGVWYFDPALVQYE